MPFYFALIINMLADRFSVIAKDKWEGKKHYTGSLCGVREQPEADPLTPCETRIDSAENISLELN